MSVIRNATITDAAAILQIYEYYVVHTAITFEYTLPSLEEFRERMIQTMKKYPYLVIIEDGQIQGYAYAGPFVAREAYNWSCEMTIYMDRNARKQGLGRMLYEALEQALQRMGILNLYACIGYPEQDDEYLTTNSADFHAHLGYRRVGTFYNCGYKFQRWYHMIWVEKVIGIHEKEQIPVVPYPDLMNV
ncbi:GNAT family N-acetyltransferase [uncultured Megasphaera sp.]|uniref:GNAT family N-acetyltransferase n=1 Tax=uncultured Megasphaera sp. TaxID=165188 RepID=UPI00265806E9|nr:GNAT family N-acetyltransferase [uncultured Megasphaera sp.]